VNFRFESTRRSKRRRIKGSKIMKQLKLMLLVTLLSANSAFAGAHLGTTFEDFESTWGRPTTKKQIDRTARFVWGPYNQQTNLPPGVREAQVQFLDNIACSVLLRGRLGVEENWDWVVKRICQMIPDCPHKLPRPRRDSAGDREFRLKDGTFVAVRRFKARTIIAISGPLFLQNQEVFTSESAKIYPPKADH
jgi:hypothetical protein